MIQGSCLCGGVRIEIARADGTFELCHCSRCRKATGSAFCPWLEARREDVHLLQGGELIRTYEKPVRESPPGYRVCFCANCGSLVPDLDSGAPRVDIPAGFLDDDPLVRPDKHIHVDTKATWFEIGDELPQFDSTSLQAYRKLQAPR